MIKEREAELADHAASRASIRSSAEEANNQLELEGGWDELAEVLQPNTAAEGYFTDKEWKKEPAPKADPREAELIEYGMRYGLSREESEDIYEENAHKTRANIRWELRNAAGMPNARLAEGERISGPNSKAVVECDPDGFPFPVDDDEEL